VDALLTLDALAVLVVAFGVGIVVGLTGMGGGALMTPALIALGVNPAAAVANDLVAASVSKSVGAAVHWRSGSPNLRLAALLVAGSVPTAFAGGFIVNAVGDEAARTDFLTTAIGGALLLAAGSYALRIYLQLGHVAHGNVAGHEDPHIRTIPTVLVGAVGGLLVGITSVGSGSLIMVTLLILYPRLSAVRLVGTDLLQAVPLVMAAAVGHVLTEGVDWEVLLPLVAGGTPGTIVGARIARTIQQSVIRRGIFVVLTVTGLKLLGLPPAWVGIVGGALILLGPVAWGYLRQRRGLPPFDENAAAWRVTDDDG
jgi:uncharacterized membrane protein YfcA